MTKSLFLAASTLCSFALFAANFDCLDLPNPPVLAVTEAEAPDADFKQRDALPQTEVPQSQWQSPAYGSFGPCPLSYPPVQSKSPDPSRAWARSRVAAVAKKFIGLPYRHHHIPAMGGLDCSNFTAWVYNYGFGIRFSSHIERQSREAGKKLDPAAALMPGDLIFLYDLNRTRIAHVAILLDQTNVIDSTGPGVAIRAFAGRYRSHFAWARRVLSASP